MRTLVHSFVVIVNSPVKAKDSTECSWECISSSGPVSTSKNSTNQNIRFKTGLEYNIKKWKLDPKFSAEIFNHFEEGDENGFSKYRLTLGTDYKFKNFGKIALFYRIEKELNETIPKTTNIIGLKYTYTIKNK